MISYSIRRGLGLTAAIALTAALAACGGGSEPPPKVAIQQAPVSNHKMGAYKVGAPYQIDGTWYYPREDYDYDERGVASWYGPDFDGKQTANGEIYDMYDLTAAHRTLPLPCIVRVTNLENGKSIVLRINDRGPFAKSRIIDVSKRVADLLGFHQAGTTHVRVQVLPDESRALKAEILTASGDMPKVTPAPATVIASQPLPPPPQPQAQAQAAPASKGSSSFSLISNANAAEATPIPAAKAAKPVPPDTRFASPMWVQVATYRDVMAATDLQQRLQPIGKVSISQIKVGGDPVYRVRLGPVTTQSQANKLLESLRAKGLNDVRLVSN